MAEEIYLLEENKPIVFEPDKQEEWKRKIEELGLEGQKTLLNDSGGISPVPFQHMNHSMEHVYETLCPNKINVNSFKLVPIPLMVLDIIKLCQNENYFDSIQVWCDEQSPDPILVGYIGTDYNKEPYILARWGDELETYITLKERALKKWIENSRIILNEKLSQCQQNIQDIENLGNKYINGNWVSI